MRGRLQPGLAQHYSVVVVLCNVVTNLEKLGLDRLDVKLSDVEPVHPFPDPPDTSAPGPTPPAAHPSPGGPGRAPVSGRRPVRVGSSPGRSRRLRGSWEQLHSSGAGAGWSGGRHPLGQSIALQCTCKGQATLCVRSAQSRTLHPILRCCGV